MFIPQLIVWLGWSFIELSIKTPIIETFQTNESRGYYLMFLSFCFMAGCPYIFPFEKEY